MLRRKTLGQKSFAIFNYLLLTFISLSMFLPFLNVLAQSFSGGHAIASGQVMFWPVDWSLAYYKYVFNDVSIWRAFGISVYITVVGTAINIAMTSLLAYPLSRQEFLGRKFILLGIVFTMIFTAPLIPEFILMRNLNLVNTLWALMLPTAISAFNLIVMRSFFMQIPAEIIESSRIDGCGELRLLWGIILPLSKPVIATVGIFYSVMNWNTYKNALYYLNDRNLYPLQIKLREMLITDDINSSGNEIFADIAAASPQGIQMTVIVIATVPIVMVYPFLQKYFIKGMLIGSLKG
jgi:putative aldouronate transport system permease protein